MITSKYPLCPSAKIVSYANVDFPDPDTPVITVNLFLGIFTSIFFKLFNLAPNNYIIFNRYLCFHLKYKNIYFRTN